MKKYFLILMVIIGLPGLIEIEAQDADCIVRQSFPANKSTRLIVSNKFGNVTVVNTSVDSVIICGTATVDHSDKRQVEKSLSLINMGISSEGNNLNIKTTYDEKFFTSAYKTGRKRFNVNYLIKTPKYINLSVDNEFGNIEIEDIAGHVSVSLSYGNLHAGALLRGNEKPVNTIILRQSKGVINYSNWLYMEAYHSPLVNITMSQALSVISEFSTINIGEVNSLVINSSSDIYSVGSASNIIAETKLTKSKIQSVSDILKANTSLGSLTVYNLMANFQETELSANGALCTIGFDSDVSFSFSGRSIGSVIDYSQVKTENFVKLSQPGNTFEITGMAGPDKATKSNMSVNIKNGKLELITNTGRME